MNRKEPWVFLVIAGIVAAVVALFAIFKGSNMSAKLKALEPGPFMFIAGLFVGFLSAALIGGVLFFFAVPSNNNPLAEREDPNPVPLMDRPVTEMEFLKARYRIKGFVGGGKLNLLEDQKIKRILLSKYNIAVTPYKMGSMEMVKADRKKQDFIWPGYEVLQSGFLRSETIFNSPVVIYAGWDTVGNLMRQGIVEKRENAYYIVQFDKLVAGNDVIETTDPTRSASGNMFTGLLANTFSRSTGGDGVASINEVEALMPGLQLFYKRLGTMERSSSDLFSRFASSNRSDVMVVGYENQLIEFIQANPENRTLIKDSICVLYPEPTVLSSHPIISFTENGNLLIEAMFDKDIQAIVWSEHGFRPGSTSMGFDAGVTAARVKITPMPSTEVMDRIMESL